MTVDEVHELFAYNRWANQRMLDAVSGLDHDAFNRDLKNSFPSVRDTVAHVLHAEWIWLMRWLGSSPSGAPSDWDLSSVSAIRRQWDEVERERNAFLAGLTQASLHAEIAYRNTQGQPFTNPLSQLLRHVINHSTYHRGQVTTMLRQLGAPASSTDLVLYYRERAAAHT